jgi:hypothetical protein
VMKMPAPMSNPECWSAQGSWSTPLRLRTAADALRAHRKSARVTRAGAKATARILCRVDQELVNRKRLEERKREAIRRSRKVTATVQSAGPSLLRPGATPHTRPDQVVRGVRAAKKPSLCVAKGSDTTSNPIPWPRRAFLDGRRPTELTAPFSGLQDPQYVVGGDSLLRLLRHQTGTIRGPRLLGAPAPTLSRRRAVEKVCP